MKTKIIRLFLLLMVITVWGMIYLKMSGPDVAQVSVVQTNAAPAPVAEESLKKIPEQFSLERDPFLGRRKRTVAKRSTTPAQPRQIQSARKKPDSPEVKPFTWPEISFKGFVTPKNNEASSVAILMVSGKERLVNKGTVVDRITVSEVSASKVVLEYDGEQRTLSTGSE